MHAFTHSVIHSFMFTHVIDELFVCSFMHSFVLIPFIHSNGLHHELALGMPASIAAEERPETSTLLTALASSEHECMPLGQ